MVIATDNKVYTPEEYLSLEAESEIRHEYLNGEIREMAGGTTNHNEIITNLCVAFKPRLRTENYRLFTENVRVWIEKEQIHTYPDLMVIAGEPIYYGTGTTTVINPCLIIEVSSKSTKNYDRGDKFDYYRSLPSLQEYILVEQSRFQVLQHTKTNSNQWLLTEYDRMELELTLGIMPLSITLAKIYEDIDFSLSG
jgi:Uma2 family endonuclease